MQIETWSLTGDSAGTRRELTLYRYGQVGAAPCVYLQAGLHADEMPGVLVLQHLLTLLDEVDARGGIVGEVLVVPVANPIGLAQWAFQRPLGRQDADTMHNFNRGYPELAKLVGDALENELTQNSHENRALIRKAFRAALADIRPRSDMQEQQVALMTWSCSADYVLDLHCDHFAVMHLYANARRPDDTALLCRCTGSKLALIEDLSGGNAFDEAHTVPWWQLRERFGARFPIPDATFASTLEYRGQFDVHDDLAAADAAGLMVFLGAIGALSGGPQLPTLDGAVHLPLGGAADVHAPQGGVVSWAVAVGAQVASGQVLGHVTDPVSRRRLPLLSPVAGMLFRTELWRSCLRGQSLAHVAGEVVIRAGDLLSD
ncbi:MAG: succinylglutamate desuccinylase/aspartoacylase family protein [bacterium]